MTLDVDWQVIAFVVLALAGSVLIAWRATRPRRKAIKARSYYWKQ